MKTQFYSEVNKEFLHKGVLIKAVKTSDKCLDCADPTKSINPCTGCFFFSKNNAEACNPNTTPCACAASKRKDGVSVKFVRVRMEEPKSAKNERLKFLEGLNVAATEHAMWADSNRCEQFPFFDFADVENAVGKGAEYVGYRCDITDAYAVGYAELLKHEIKSYVNITYDHIKEAFIKGAELAKRLK